MRSNGAYAGPSMNRRRLLAAGGGVAAAGTLAACGGPEEEETAEDGGLTWDEETQNYVMEADVESGETPIKIWFEDEALAQASIAAFQAVYPDVKVEYELVAKNDTVEKMSLAGPAGNGADVYMTFYDQVARAIDDASAAPLGNYSNVLADRVPEAFVSVVSSDQGMCAVPLTTESIALFYNKTLLKQITGSDAPATTWEEIQAVAATYNDAAANTWTIQFTPGEIYHGYAVLSSAGWRAYPDGDINEPGFDDPALTTALTYFQGLRELFDVPSADATDTILTEEFAKGTLPYAITGPWAFAAFDAAAAELGFEYGVTVLPQVDGGQPAASMAGMHCAAVSGSTKIPAAARVFANFLASDEGAKVMYEVTGQIPALTAELQANIEGLADDPHVAGIVAQSAQAELFPTLPSYYWETGNTLLSDVWNDLSSVEDAQAKAADGYDELNGL
ncbi:extracellular solute-binding protein [Glycomyces sp. NPDC047369]